MTDTRNTILLISQVYVPDPAAVGQYMHDVAVEMVRRGWRVVVFAARRGYDDASRQYKWRETLDGVEVIRFPLSSFGKGSIAMRLLAGGLFVALTIFPALLLRRLRCVLVSTSPPVAPLAALAIGGIRRTSIKYWAMDINPDQMVALGKAAADSVPVRVFDWLNRMILRRAEDIVTLDRFMRATLAQKADVGDKIRVIPLWPHGDQDEAVSHAQNPFRAKHGLGGKFVVMYSGNHSPSNPITTILQASLQMLDMTDLVFVFVGGGAGRVEITQFIAQNNPGNIIGLPYQPLSELKYSLPAADLHVVSVGADIVGICHPSKVYGAMAAGRPILLLGPDPCHVSELVRRQRIGWRVDHGDVDETVRVLRIARRMLQRDMEAMGERARSTAQSDFSRHELCGRFADVLEHRH